MKRILLVIALVIIAAVAGIVRSHTRANRTGLRFDLATTAHADGQLRDEIRKTFDLSPGAEVTISGINGSVTVETGESKTAEVYIVRTAKEAAALEKRKVVVEGSANSLSIRGEKGDVGFFDRMFGSNPTETVTVKLPRQVSLNTSGVNGSVTVGELDGAVEVSGINGRVDVRSAAGSAGFHGINGNIAVAIRSLTKDGIRISGVNGNIELRLANEVNAELEAHGMNGSVRSDSSDILVTKSERGNRYSAHIGSGENPIEVSGVNGNVRLTRATMVTAATAGTDAK